MNPITRYALAALLATTLGLSAEAADLIAGYSLGANDPLQLGSDFIIDQAALGGGDALNGDGFFGWAAEYNEMWEVGTPVSISGLALPIKAGGTQNGDWTFTFFELDGGADPNGFDGYSFVDGTGESVLGSVTAAFTGNGTTGTDEYFVDFDVPLDFTSASTGFAFHMQSTAATEVKIRPAGLAASRGVRVALGTGAPLGGANPNFRASIAGTPVAFDPPLPPALAHRLDASVDDAGNRRWQTLESSVEQYQLSAPQPGDYNGDGLTNASDYTVFRDNLNGDADLLLAAGSRDPGNSGLVNQADEAFWAANYGAPAIVSVDDPSVPGITAAYRGGAIGQANVYQDTLVDGTLASRQDGSFEVWFKPDDLASGDQMIYEVGGSGNGLVIGLQDDELFVHVKGQFAGNEQTLTTTLADADWTQVVAVMHNTFSSDVASADDYLDLYIDGVLVASNVNATTDINRWAGGNQAGLGKEGGNFADTSPFGADISSATEFALNGEIAIFEYATTAWDASEVASRFGAITSPGTTAVPEPGAAAMALLAGAAALRRRF